MKKTIETILFFSVILLPIMILSYSAYPYIQMETESTITVCFDGDTDGTVCETCPLEVGEDKCYQNLINNLDYKDIQ